MIQYEFEANYLENWLGPQLTLFLFCGLFKTNILLNTNNTALKSLKKRVQQCVHGTVDKNARYRKIQLHIPSATAPTIYLPLTIRLALISRVCFWAITNENWYTPFTGALKRMRFKVIGEMSLNTNTFSSSWIALFNINKKIRVTLHKESEIYRAQNVPHKFVEF